MKAVLREKAISLRKEGLSYSEIRMQIAVSKSTLSLWLRSVGLAKRQKQRITLKRLLAQKHGAEKQREKRLRITQEIREKSLSEVNEIVHNPLFVMGVMLYWGEGSKAKEIRPSEGVIFSNSDPLMIKLFIRWIKVCLRLPPDRITFEIYVHEKYKTEVGILKTHWAFVTGFPAAKFDKIYFKKDKLKTNRKNIGLNYWGQLRMKIKKSTNINRQISGWIEGLSKYCGVV